MEPTLIYETIHGSQAFGLAREGSDTDRKGVIVGPRAWYFGFVAPPEQIELSADHVHYELRKLMRLLCANNPTVLEMLWTREEHHRVVHCAGARLLEARERFLSKRVADTFGRYALSQLGRIERHRRWLLAPPKSEPMRADFGLPERTVIAKDQLGAAEALLEKHSLDKADVSSNFLEVLDRERRYRAARKEWQQYRYWLVSRNPDRAQLEAAHGYNTKHAMHLVRLSRMAIEILERGEVRVWRDDREELLAVRDGRWSYDELIAQVSATRAGIEEARERSTLPDAPDEESLNELTVELVQDVIERSM